MKTKNIKNSQSFTIIVFLLGCMGLVSIMVLDKLYWHTGVITEGWPNFSPGHIIRSIMIFISILSVFWGLIGSSKPKLILDGNNRVPLERLSILVALSISVVILFLFIYKRSFFSALSLEDGPIEWGSAFLLFGCCIIFAFSFSKSHNILNITKVTQLSLALLALLFFVMAMEEVSWFQRVLEIETPKSFDGNVQHEMNLHNFATDFFENIYYFGVFFFLVILSFVRFLFPYISNNNYLRIFIARPFVGIIASIAYAYSFTMWNIIFSQIAFFSSIVILFAYATFSSSRNERYIILFTIFVIVTTQVLFLISGKTFSRSHEVTEYKEFFIPLALFIYSLDVLANINNRVRFPEKN